MNTREISARLHDILGAACRVRQPGPGRPADADLAGIDEVKAGLRDLIRTLGDEAPARASSRIATAGAFPPGPVAGTRAVVQHRSRERARTATNPGTSSARPQPSRIHEGSGRAPSPARRAAETEFASLTGRAL